MKLSGRLPLEQGMKRVGEGNFKFYIREEEEKRAKQFLSPIQDTLMH